MFNFTYPLFFNAYNVVTLDLFYIITILLAVFVIILVIFSKNPSVSDKTLATGLQSGFNSFTVKMGLLSITFLCNDVSYITITNGFNYISSFDFTVDTYIKNAYDLFMSMQNNSFTGHNMHPISKQAYEIFISMKNIDFTVVKSVAKNMEYSGYFCFTPFQFIADNLHFHTNLAIAKSLHNLLIGLLTSIGLVVAVNIHSILAFFANLLSILSDLFSSVLRKCANYYDPVKDQFISKSASNPRSSGTNNSTSQQGVSYGGGSGKDDGDQDPNDRPYNFKHIDALDDSLLDYFIDLLETLLKLHGDFLGFRAEKSTSTDTKGYHANYYGNHTSRGKLNEKVSWHQLMHYAFIVAKNNKLFNLEDLEKINTKKDFIFNSLKDRFTIENFLRLHAICHFNRYHNTIREFDMNMLRSILNYLKYLKRKRNKIN